MASWQELKEEGESLLSWAKQQQRRKLVRIDTQAVPAGIIDRRHQQRRRLLLHDLRVQSRGADDAVYDANEELRRRLARGNLLLQVDCDGEGDGDGEGEGDGNCLPLSAPGCYLLLYALRKFTGGYGDDDDRSDGDGGGDGDEVWRRYFTEPMANTARIVRTRKANGEAFHLAAVRIAAGVFFVGGSKNTHLLFAQLDHLKLYTADRYRVAKEFCGDFLQYFHQLPASSQSDFTNFLLDNQATAVFEILYKDHQHVELLTNEAPLPQFITFTSNRTSWPGITLLPPDKAIEVASGFGLDCTHCELCELSQLEAACAEIRGGHGYEGEVLYFVNSSGSAIGLLKKKTAWYILARALREKLKSAAAQCRRRASDFNMRQHEAKVDTRLSSIQSWLGLSDDVTGHWRDIARRALRLCVARMSQPDSQQFLDLLHRQFPVFWRRFVEEQAVDDRVQL